MGRGRHCDSDDDWLEKEDDEDEVKGGEGDEGGDSSEEISEVKKKDDDHRATVEEFLKEANLIHLDDPKEDEVDPLDAFMASIESQMEAEALKVPSHSTSTTSLTASFTPGSSEVVQDDWSLMRAGRSGVASVVRSSVGATKETD
eukprot:GHVN01096665.1.p1 GENE.GHVN01096665.1~~GHVN01096665.1.p1  ORF type:complete len:145 (-),score=64.71 GHVN01096665.1:117-551(-)